LEFLLQYNESELGELDYRKNRAKNPPGAYFPYPSCCPFLFGTPYMNLTKTEVYRTYSASLGDHSIKLMFYFSKSSVVAVAM
jgi:hypothetical protein